MTATTTPDRLDPKQHPWLDAPDTRAVMAALEAARPGAVRYVGGCVRNALMGAPVGDIDIASQLEPEAVIAAAQAAGLKVAPTGLAHGTVTVIVEGRPFEVTTLRRDVTTDGRNATVAFSDDWEEDSRRRDFTFNAIYADGEGVLFDPQGGIADALARRLIFIGDPAARIREDYLRILRFFRFAAWYGAPPGAEPAFDKAAVAACRAQAAGLDRLSAERVWKEVKTLLAATDPTPALRVMAEAGVLERVLPEAIALDLIGALTALERGEGWTPDPMLRLAALIPRIETTAARVRRRLKLSNAEGGRLSAWAAQAANPRLVLGQSEDDIAKTLYALDVQAFLDRARLAWAIDAAPDTEQGADADAWRALIGFAHAWRRPVFPVTGKDLAAAGVAKGPRMGATLKALEALWVRGGFKADREALLAALSLVGPS